jgi:hypothetical protein
MVKESADRSSLSEQSAPFDQLTNYRNLRLNICTSEGEVKRKIKMAAIPSTAREIANPTS